MEQQKEMYRPYLGDGVPKMPIIAWAVAHSIPHHGMLPVPYVCGSVFQRAFWPQFTVGDKDIFHGLWGVKKFVLPKTPEETFLDGLIQSALPRRYKAKFHG